MCMRNDVIQEDFRVEATRNHEIDWDAYASRYDLMATLNPSYYENIELLRSVIRDAGLPERPVICDVGAGTGNFICALARDFPDGHFVHLDADPTMNQIAARKYSSSGVAHVDLHCSQAQDAGYEVGRFDLIICVNALYAMHPQTDVLRSIRRWLKPSGVFVVIDYGRQISLLDWGWFMFRDSVRRRGIWQSLKLLKSSAEGIRQNKKGSQGQADGTYWLHTTEEFGEHLADAGFSVERLGSCYRDYCDWALCRGK